MPGTLSISEKVRFSVPYATYAEMVWAKGQEATIRELSRLQSKIVMAQRALDRGDVREARRLLGA
jgi:hypothetical protein